MLRALKNKDVINQMIENMKSSIVSGKEQGFNICESREGTVFPAETCKGSSCYVRFGGKTKQCPDNTDIIGNFHTHPAFYDRRVRYFKNFGRGEIVTQKMSRPIEDETIMNPVPSPGDLLGLMAKDKLQFTCLGVQTKSNTQMHVGCISKNRVFNAMREFEPRISINNFSSYERLRNVYESGLFTAVVGKMTDDAEFRNKYLVMDRFNLR